MLSKIFLTKCTNKNNFDPIRSKVLSSGYDNNDYKRERKMKLLENLFNLKLDKEYIDKFSLLLYNYKKTKNYPLKRKNLKKTIYKYDEDNNLYLTFPKFNSVDKNKEKFKTIDYSSQVKGHYFITDKNALDDEDNLEDLRRKINEEIENNNNINFKTISNNEDIENEEIENKGKKLYNLLKTKYSHDIYKKDGPSLPRIINKKTKEDSSIIKRISDIDPILGRKIYENNIKFLTKNQKLNFFYLSELEVFNSMDKLSIKKHLLNKNKFNSCNKKNKLLIKDIFHYDKNKWNKISLERKYNENEAKINEFNEKNRQKLLNLKNNIDKLENEKFKTEIDVQETLNKIDLFMKKNASPLSTQYLKERSIKPSKVKTKK